MDRIHCLPKIMVRVLNYIAIIQCLEMQNSHRIGWAGMWVEFTNLICNRPRVYVRTPNKPETDVYTVKRDADKHVKAPGISCQALQRKLSM